LLLLLLLLLAPEQSSGAGKVAASCFVLIFDASGIALGARPKSNGAITHICRRPFHWRLYDTQMTHRLYKLRWLQSASGRSALGLRISPPVIALKCPLQRDTLAIYCAADAM
jgi:hypothetical protein